MDGGRESLAHVRESFSPQAAVLVRYPGPGGSESLFVARDSAIQPLQEPPAGVADRRGEAIDLRGERYLAAGGGRARHGHRNGAGALRGAETGGPDPR